jgi:hypothetical protein
MGALLSSSAPGYGDGAGFGPAAVPNASAIYRWLGAARRSPSVGQRAQTVYTAIVVAAIFGALVYGTASSALAQVISPETVARWGPSLALLALLGAGYWGTVQGPVVFSAADVGCLLAAPLRRAGLVGRPLRVAFVLGFGVGVLVAGVAVVGLTGQGRSVAAARIFGFGAGLGLIGLVAVALAWTVSSRTGAERALRWMSWPVAVLAGGLLVFAFDGGAAGRDVALWSGPWGWAVQAGAGRYAGAWGLGLAAVAVAAALVVGLAWRSRGAGETERFVVRAEGRAHLQASLMDLNVRTGRRDLAAVAAGGGTGRGSGSRRVWGVRWLRDRLSALDARRFEGRRGAQMAVVWRGLVIAVRLPSRPLVSALLAGGGTALVLLDLAEPVAVIAGAVLIYVASAWLLEPMRVELDAPSRAPVFLGARPGRALVAHVLLPSLVVSASVVVSAVVVALAAGLSGSGVAAALALVVTSAAVVCCAGMSARRGGRLPHDLLITAVSSDPSGGGLVLLGWLLLWPAVAVAVVYVPVRAISVHSTVAHAAVSVGVGVVVAVGALRVQQRDPPGV